MKVLMCPPTYYGVHYEINPWMKLRNKPDPALAQSQWKNLVATLRRLNVPIALIRPHPHLPDMVFTANAGLVAGRAFVPSNFRFVERRGEREPFVRYFRRRAFRIREVPADAYFEGEGDVLRYRDMLFGGFRFRSDIRAHAMIADLLKTRLISLELVDPWFYHLDTCFFPVDDRVALYYPGAFDRYGRRAIRHFVRDPIPVTRVDARNFVCNGLAVGKTLLVNQMSRRLRSGLSKRGYIIRETPTTEFLKAGGSVKCMMLRLADQ